MSIPLSPYARAWKAWVAGTMFAAEQLNTATGLRVPVTAGPSDQWVGKSPHSPIVGIDAATPTLLISFNHAQTLYIVSLSNSSKSSFWICCFLPGI